MTASVIPEVYVGRELEREAVAAPEHVVLLPEPVAPQLQPYISTQWFSVAPRLQPCISAQQFSVVLLLQPLISTQLFSVAPQLQPCISAQPFEKDRETDTIGDTVSNGQ
jgi:hypothetical protein